MGQIAETSLGDVKRAVLRYRPVAIAVATVVVAVSLLPGAPRPPAELASQRSPTAPAVPRSGETDRPAPAPGASADTDLSVARPVPAPPPLVPAAAGPPPTAWSPAPGSGVEPWSPPRTAGDGELGSAEPLRVVAAGWASRQAGTPLAATGVPDDTLPVGVRVGNVDKATFLRLTGDDTNLVLTDDPEGRRDAVDGAIGVRACPILDAGWQEAEAQSFDDAPAWSDDGCVDGEAGDDGTWRFDLTTLGDAVDGAGVALVPAAGTVDFQVAFVRP